MTETIAWLSDFETWNQVQTWLEENQASAYTSHVQSAWDAMRYRESHPEQFAVHRLDYRLRLRRTHRSRFGVWLKVEKRTFERDVDTRNLAAAQ